MSYTLPIDLNVEAWNEWCEYRKEARKKAVSSFAAKKQFKMLCKYSYEQQQQIIDISISNDYTGLFELKVTPKQSDTMDLLTDRSWADHLVEDKNLLN